MKFGHLDTHELENLDLNLPEDHPDTHDYLNESENTKTGEVFIGCAKWNRKEWVGDLYPQGTKPAHFLSEYTKHFNAVELNTTFYSWKKESVESWLSQTSGGFRYCPKFSRTISHFKRLKDVEALTQYYIENCEKLGKHFGCAFLQMPDNFTPKKFEDLRHYLEGIPKEFPLCLELRHKEWFDNVSVADEIFHLLKEQHKSMVITDTAGRRDVIHQRLTSDVVFIRFNGYGLHPSDFKRMDEWVLRIKNWLEAGTRNIYFFPHQANESYTPVCCAYMIRELNTKCGLDLGLSPTLIKMLDL